MSTLEQQLVTQLAEITKELENTKSDMRILGRLAEVRHCAECGKPFPAIKARDAKYCRPACKTKAHKKGL